MTESENPNPHKFRYLIQPGSNFQFLARSRACLIVSILLMLGCVAALFINKEVRGAHMNWTIDFKGGTEVHYAFADKATGNKTKVDPGAIRKALKDGGETSFDVSDSTWKAKDAAGKEIEVQGIMVRTPRFSAIKPAQADQVKEAFLTKLPQYKIEKATWSGERLYVRSPVSMVKKAEDGTLSPVPEVLPFFVAAGLELKAWSPEEAVLYNHADEGTGEHNAIFAVRGIDIQLERVIEASLPAIDAQAVQSYGVGAKAGAQLRDDAIKSIVYALFLIALYLAFRFDIRYVPGAAFTTLHNAIIVIGVFAITWTEVSLTTVAAILTVIGYSVNDTVVIFDRIRENQAKLKDKRLERIVDISLNETLVRSVMTGACVLGSTLIMNVFGDGLVRNFAFAMNVGVIAGTYASMFLAAPIFMWFSRKFYSGPGRQRAYAAAVQPEE